MLVELWEYADNAHVKLNQCCCERMDLVVGFKFLTSKIPADPVLNRWMRPGWRRAIYQFEQDYQGIRDYDPDAPLEPHAFISNSAEYMVSSEKISFIFFILETWRCQERMIPCKMPGLVQ